MGHVIGAVLMIWSAVSMIWSPVTEDALDALWKTALFAGCFCLGAEAKSPRPVYRGLGLGIGISGVLAMAQWFGWSGIAQASPPAGLFINRNILAEIAAVALVGVIGSRIWWAVPALIPAVTLTLCRGALVGLACAGLLVLWQRSRVAALSLAACLVAIIAADIASVPNDRSSVMERAAIWLDASAGMSWQGQGIGSFNALYPAYATRIDTLRLRPNHAHNELIEIAFELGPVGLGSLLLLATAALCARGRRTEKLAFVVILAESGFEFPLHMPLTGFMAAVLAGHLCGAGPDLRDLVAGGRGLLRQRLSMGHGAGPGDRRSDDRGGDIPA